jgi:hypothetical protein
MAGTAFLALKTDALIVQSYCHPDGLGKIRCIIEKPFIYQKTAHFDEDIFSLTALIFRSMEKQFLDMPEHWLYINQLSSRLDIPLPTENTIATLIPQLVKISQSIGADHQGIIQLTELLNPQPLAQAHENTI